MNPEDIKYLSDVQALAEAAMKEANAGNDQKYQHHTRNAVTSLRGVDLKEDSEETIKRLCDETIERLKPFITINIKKP